MKWCFMRKISKWWKKSRKEILSYALLSICIWYYVYYQENAIIGEVTMGYQLMSVLFFAAVYLFYQDSYGEIAKEICKCTIIVTVTKFGDIILLGKGDIFNIFVNIVVVLVYSAFAFFIVRIFRSTKNRYMEPYATRTLLLQLILFVILYFGGGARNAMIWILSENWYNNNNEIASKLEMILAYICAYGCIDFLTNKWQLKTEEFRKNEVMKKEAELQAEIDKQNECYKMKKEIENSKNEIDKLHNENKELKQIIQRREEKDKRRNRRYNRRKSKRKEN